MSSASSNYNYVDNKGNKILIYPAINPEIVTYITKVENEKEKTDLANNIQSQSKNLINMKKKPISFEYNIDKKQQSSNLIMNENVNYDKAKRTQAKKGLLYLLNNLSGGAFCPEINTYFEEMKELKVNELKNAYKQQQLKAKAKSNENKKYPFSSHGRGAYASNLNQESSKPDIIDENTNPMNKDNNYLQAFKKRPKENIDTPFKDIPMFKGFKNDYTTKELAEIYNVNEVSQAGMKFKYTKEKEAKLKLLNSENKKAKSNSSIINNEEKKESNEQKFSLIKAIDNSDESNES